eukprot:6197094-Pleurochrysis_carterae.AAC.1
MDMRGSFGFAVQEVHCFKASMIIDEDKQVLEPRVLRAHEWPGDISMVSGVVRVTGSVRLGAGCAAVKMTAGERGGSVGRDSRQTAQARGTGV